MAETTEIINRLSQPLDMQRVKRRQSSGEDSVPYLEGFDVIQTANEIFSYRWSFELVSEPRVMFWEQALTTWDRQTRERVPVLDQQTGQQRTHRAGIVYLTGRVSVELDGKSYTHADVGRLAFTGDAPDALDTALSGAATDCLKRCFRHLGDQFGLSLYDKETAKTAGTGITKKDGGLQGKGNGHNDNVHERRQSGAPKSKTEQNGMTVEQAAAVLCPVGSTQNPHWAGMPLGQVIGQTNGERMIAYLSGEQFNSNGDPARKLVKEAARFLLSQAEKAA
jgi:recombination DNA repair RAD52 pathway protein